MKSTWQATYENNTIKIVNTWLSGERLYVNGNLQDYNKNMLSSASHLTGHLISINREKLLIKAKLFQKGFFVDCMLFIDDKIVSVKKVKQ